VEITEFLSGEGFTSVWTQTQARAVLEAAGMTREGKRAMLETKVPAAREMLAKWTVRICGDAECREWAKESADGRMVIETVAEECSVCLGSNNRRAARAMTRAAMRTGRTRLLVVGGTAAQHRDLQELLPEPGPEMRFVDGKQGRHTKESALPNLNWAQLLVIWSSTPLPHAVSNGYTSERPHDLPLITVARRGIEALCREIQRSLEGGRTRG
jgi:hypothetical protein